MVFWLFKKRGVNDEVKKSFDSVKDDISKIGVWIEHLNEHKQQHQEKIDGVYDDVLQIKQDIDDIKRFISFFDKRVYNRVFKQQQTAVHKQTAVDGVQTGVYTGVQTPFFHNYLKGLTISERSIVWILLNSELKLSCEDVAALTGKTPATVRGQLNRIKQKAENLIEEHLEKNGKKRYFIEASLRDNLLEQIKVKVSTKVSKKGKKIR